MIFHVSPAEHSASIKSLGAYSPLPEKHGADVISFGTISRVGYQRKEVSDLFSSIVDGRLTKEIAQLTNSNLITQSVLIIEGKLEWTTDGNSTRSHTTITRSQFQSLITSIQLEGIIVHYTESTQGTTDIIRGLARYFDKPHHNSLQQRVSTRSIWGRTTNKGFALHLLQSFAGVGPELASAIYDYFGTVPLQWTVTESDLRHVPGIGEKRARELIEALGGTTPV